MTKECHGNDIKFRYPRIYSQKALGLIKEDHKGMPAVLSYMIWEEVKIALGILHVFDTPVYILKRHLGSIKEDHKGITRFDLRRRQQRLWKDLGFRCSFWSCSFEFKTEVFRDHKWRHSVIPAMDVVSGGGQGYTHTKKACQHECEPLWQQVYMVVQNCNIALIRLVRSFNV